MTQYLKQETIKSRIDRGSRKCLPCPLCEVLVIPGRKQYLEEKVTRDKRRRSNYSNDVPDDWKKSRPFGKAVSYFLLYITLTLKLRCMYVLNH